MNDGNRRLFLRTILAITPPPNDEDVINDILASIITICKPPPDISLDLRYGLGENSVYHGRNVFSFLSRHNYTFLEITGETRDSFERMTNEIQLETEVRAHKLTKVNLLLLFLLWLRRYPSYHMLSAIFDVSVATIHNVITSMIPKVKNHARSFIKWPSISQWREMKNDWSTLPGVVGCIDGTSTEIYKPEVQQHLYCSGHRKYHAIHAQVVVDTAGEIRFVQCGFLGHTNDAQQFHLMKSIGPNRELPFPQECFLLADKIYPNGYPLMTPYTSAQIQRKPHHMRERCKSLNDKIRKYRVTVEQAIGEIKQYRVVSTLWRHPKLMLKDVFVICAGLSCRRKILFN